LSGTKLVSGEDPKEIVGEVVSPPETSPGVGLGLFRLDALYTPSKTLKMIYPIDGSQSDVAKVDDSLQIFPFQPLWWPQIDTETGRAVENVV
jgi:hypothetical protein